MYDKGLSPATLAVYSLAFDVIARRDAFADTNPLVDVGDGAARGGCQWELDRGPRLHMRIR